LLLRTLKHGCISRADALLLLQELADSFSVTQLPSVVLVKDGAEVHRITSEVPMLVLRMVLV
jgi:hypothetical protein